MRTAKTNGPLSVQVIAGTYVVLFGINMAETHKSGLLGFAIQRTDHTRNDERYWLAGFKTFKEFGLPRGTIVPTNEHPIKRFSGGIIPRAKIIDILTE